jgi:GH24 family phage-related lysozyme (muramidase)
MNVKAMVEELADPNREGCTTWLYCDSRGLPTVGIGNLVASPKDCAALPFAHPSGTPATEDEKRDLWKAVVNAFEKGEGAGFYRTLSTLAISRAFAYELAAKRIERDFIPGIKRLCHEFDEWPEQAQRAIVDMAYNLGIGGLSHFVNFLGACQSRDWATAAKECHRATCRKSRNDWTEQMLVAASLC